MASLKQCVFLAIAWSFLGCASAPPEAPPKNDQLVADIRKLTAELQADYLACMLREERLLQEKKVELDKQIDAALEEAVVLSRKIKRRP